MLIQYQADMFQLKAKALANFFLVVSSIISSDGTIYLDILKSQSPLQDPSALSSEAQRFGDSGWTQVHEMANGLPAQ